MVCVFDCETIPDVAALKEVYGYSGNDIEIGEEAFKRQKEKTGSEFLPVIFHKVIAISAVICDDYGRFIRVSTIKGDSEKEKISQFLKFIDTKQPRLISFNGRGFDLPMLMIRAMKYNLSCPKFFDTQNKWENYRSRYDGKFHMDLLDFISEFKTVSGFNLNSICKMLSLPGKYDVAGDDVFRLYYDGNIEKINQYCQSDVLNTYCLFLKYELLRGKILISDYLDCLDSMRVFLEKNPGMSYNQYFLQFINQQLQEYK